MRKKSTLLLFLGLLLFTKVHAVEDFNDITLEDIQNFSLTSDPIEGSLNENNQMYPGTIIVYQTNEERYGKFQVLANGEDMDLELKWLTYDYDGSVFSSGNSLWIAPSFSCDLDLGLETNEGRDFWWSHDTEIIRHLIPQNGALLSIYGYAEIAPRYFADYVIGFSSQYSDNGWSAAQVLGPPDVYPQAGDIPQAWASADSYSEYEFLEMGYHFAGNATGVFIYETFNPGAVDSVFVRNHHSGEWVLMWSGQAGPVTEDARIFEVSFEETDFPVDGVRITLQCSAVGGWNEIDAIGLELNNAQPLEQSFEVNFFVDMTDVGTDLGVVFDPDIHDVYITGSFAGWTMPGSEPGYKMDQDYDDMYSITLMLEPGSHIYKYFLVPKSLGQTWDYGEWGGGSDRQIEVYGDMSVYDIFGVLSGSELSEVTFNLNMSDAEGFDPDIDVVYITGSFLGWHEPGSMTEEQLMERQEQTMVYFKSFTFEPGQHEYKYFINEGWYQGEWMGDPNRNIFVDGDTLINDVWAYLEGVPKYTLGVEVIPEGAGIVSGAGDYYAGNIITLIAEPFGSNIFSHWEFAGNEGNPVSHQLVYSLTMPQNDVFIRAVFIEVSFTGGAGTEQDPWQIAGIDDLHVMRYFLGQNHSDKYFIQVADIDLDVYPYSQGYGWEPIGSSHADGFFGHYDGNGHVVKNLYINRDTNAYQGFFGWNSGTILNLGVEDASVADNGSRAGILVGINDWGTIINCYSTGHIHTDNIDGRIGGLVGWNNNVIDSSWSSATVTGSGQLVGGLAGSSTGTVSNSYALGDVSGNERVGGLVGNLQGFATITGSFAAGNVSAQVQSAGGLVGISLGGSNVHNNYATGSVAAMNYAGGLIGYFASDAIHNSYAAGLVRGAENTGGLIGFNSHENNEYFNHCYWDTQTSGQTVSAGGIGLSTQQMLQQASFDQWDFDAMWSVQENTSYPYLAIQAEPGSHNFPVPVFSVTFVITDAETEEELENGVVTFDHITFKAGDYVLWHNEGVYSWEVFVPGYHPAEGEVEITDADVPVEVMMQPFEAGELVDIDGNTYNTIVIGEQIWMAENLRVTRYRNGDEIPSGAGLGNVLPEQDYYFVYDDNTDYAETFGHLYNGYAITDERGLCPAGWAVPTNDQWKVMEMQLGFNWREANNWGVWNGVNEGGKLKASGTQYWDLPNVGATDELGFSALPGGRRYTSFAGMGSDAMFMTSTVLGNSPKIRGLNFNQGKIMHTTVVTKGWAASVRCISIPPGVTTPEVVTGQVLTVYASYATVQGQVLDAGNATVVARGIAYGTTPQPVVETQQSSMFTDSGAGTGSFSAHLQRLNPGNTYYARAYAVNASGISYGNEVSFTTPYANLPALAQVQVENIEETSAVVSSAIINPGDDGVSEYGFVWATSEFPLYSDNHVASQEDQSGFTAEITGLQPNRVYYVRAYAVSGNNVRYSQERIVFTQPALSLPLVTTHKVENITSESAVVFAEVTDAGDAPVLARGVRISHTNGYEEILQGEGIGPFTIELTGLVSNTEYTVTAFAVNEYGKRFGNDVRFRTLFGSAEEAFDFLGSIYDFMSAFNPSGIGGIGHDNFGVKSFDLTNDLMGEDMVVHSTGHGWFNNHYQYLAHKDKDVNLTRYTWLRYYEKINRINFLLQHLDQATGTQSEKDRVKGQALALRAYSHFQLVQVFAPAYGFNPNAPAIPYRLHGQKKYSVSQAMEWQKQEEANEMIQLLEEKSNGNTDEKAGLKSKGFGILQRLPVAEVFNHLQADLDEAITLLANAGVQEHRLHIDVAVAHGLRARVALVMEDWESAAQHAQQAVSAAEANGKSLFTTQTYVAESFNSVNGSEWMWGAEIGTDRATGFASFFSHMDARFLTYANLGLQKKITAELYNTFPQTDVRRGLFITPGEGSHPLVDFNQMKFLTKESGSWAGDYLYMRLGEMYLIHAEALARGAGTATQAQQALYELVSQRDEEYPQSVSTGEALIDEILLHRRMELWGEGFGALDIKRLQKPLNRAEGEGNHDPDLAQVLYIPANNDMFNWEIPFHYYLEAEVEGNGYVLMDGQAFDWAPLVSIESVIELSAFPGEGYAFVYWVMDGEIISDNPVFEFHMPQRDVILVAVFESADEVTYVINAQASPDEGGEISGTGEFAPGALVTLTATPAEGYEFVNWTEQGQEIAGAGQVYSFEAYSNRTLVAHFQLKTYTIMATVSPLVGGRINGVQQLVGTWQYGEEVTLNAIANAGFVFAGWKEGVTPVEAEANYTFTATSNRTLVAQFETDFIAISAQPNPAEGGEIFGAGVYTHGEPVTLIASPAAGFAFENWSEDGTVIDGADAVYGFIAEESRDMVANFSTQNYSITLLVNPSDGGQVAGEGFYAHGQIVTVTAVPEDGYRFVSWKAGNTIVSTDAEYTFTATANRILVASFAKKNYLVTVNSFPANNLGGSAIGGGTFAHGTQISLVASPNLGYDFAGWTLAGESEMLEEETLFSFEVTSAIDLTAHFSGNTYEITANTADALMGVVSGGGTYYSDDIVALQAHPLEGYYFLRWMQNGQQVSVQNPYLFSAIQDRTLTAEFAEIWWDDDKQTKDTRVLITASVQPEELGLVLNQGKYDPGTEVPLIASPNAGVIFVGWLDEDENMIMDGDDPMGAEYTFTASDDLHLTALFDGGDKLTVSVAADPVDGGMVTVSGDGEFYTGQLAELSAQANAGFEFVKWTLQDDTQVSVNANYSFTVTEDRSLVAHFREQDTYELTLLAHPAEAGALNGAGNHVEGATVDISAIAEEGYTFQHWELGTDLFSNDSHTQVTMTGNITLDAYFEKNSYLITAAADEAAKGTVTGGGTYEHGDAVELQAVPASGYYFVHWTEDGDILMDDDTSIGKNYSFTATQARSLVAHFARISYTINAVAHPGEGGIIQGAGTYNHLESVTLVAEPAAGYEFDKWIEGEVELADAGATYTFNATANRDLTAHFSLKDFTLTALVLPAEAGIVTGAATLNMDAPFTLTATANEGWVFLNWTYQHGEDVVVVQDDDQNPVGPLLEGTMPAVDLTYTANFSRIGYIITASAGEGGSIDPDGEVDVPHGEDQSFTITPDTGYHIIAVEVDGEDKGAITSYLFESVTDNHTITAQFAINTYTLTYVAGDNGTLQGELSQSVEHGEDGTEVTAVPDANYHFVQWSDGVTDNPRKDESVSGDITLTAEFAINTYTLTYLAGENGSIEGDATQTVEHSADGSEVTALPATGYHFVKWSDDVTDNPRKDEDVTADITVTAEFAINTYTLTYLADANGTIEGEATQTLEHGANGSEVTAVPATGYHFVKWSDDVTDNPRKDEDVTADITVTAEFAINTYTLTYLADANGTIEGEATQTLEHGADGSEVTAVPATGYHFVKWSDDVTDNPRKDEDVTADITVTAEFAINTYTLTINIAGQGSVTVDGEAYTDAITLDAGTTPELLAVPDAGWQFDGWSGDLISSDATITLTMNDNKTLTATFSEIPAPVFELSLTVQPEGAGTLTGEGEYEEGEEVTVTATAIDNYVFINWTDAQENVLSDQASYTFHMPGNDLTLIAVFDIVDNIMEHLAPVTRLFPNPARESFTVSSDQLIHRIIIADITGKVVYDRSDIDSREHRLSVAAFESGIYFVRTLSQFGQQIHKVQVVR